MKNKRSLQNFEILFRLIPILFAFGIVIAFKGYDLYFSDFDLSFGYIGSFLIAIAICAIVQIVINKNPMIRNTKIGIISGTILTIEMMLFLLFVQYHIVFSAPLVSATMFFSIWIEEKIIKINRENHILTAKLKRWCKNCANSLVVYALCIVMIVPASVGVYEEYHKYSLSAEEWATFVSWFNESNEDSKESETVTIPHGEKITDLSKWDSLDIEEKERLIRAVALIEKENLGINKDVEVVVLTEKMSTYTLGYYTDEKNEIYINYKHLNEGELSDVLNTVIHEMHHAFVYYTISTLDYKADEVINNYYYKRAREWKENSENYISSDEGFDKFEARPIEADARAYAEERVDLYMNFVKNDCTITS